jgi:hypothetical protein
MQYLLNDYSFRWVYREYQLLIKYEKEKEFTESHEQ